MSTPHTIPLPVLVRAAAALKAVKDLPAGEAVRGALWLDILNVHSALSYQLELVMKDQRLEVTTP